MACIVYQKDAGGRVYAYSSESFWDKEKGQPRSKRTYLGRVNPETGEIIKGRQNGKNYKTVPKFEPNIPSDDEKFQRLAEVAASKDAEIGRLNEEITSLREQVAKLSAALQKIIKTASDASM